MDNDVKDCDYEFPEYWADELFLRQEMAEIGKAINAQIELLPDNLRKDWKDVNLMLEKQFFISASEYIDIPYISKITQSESIEMTIINAILNS